MNMTKKELINLLDMYEDDDIVKIGMKNQLVAFDITNVKKERFITKNEEKTVIVIEAEG